MSKEALLKVLTFPRLATLSNENETRFWLYALHACVVDDVIVKYSFNSSVRGEIRGIWKGLQTLPLLSYLRLFDGLSDALNEIFHGLDYDHGVKILNELTSDNPELLPHLGRLKKVVFKMWEAVGCDHIRFLADVYQIAAFPLRIDAQGAVADFDTLKQINASRDEFRPSPTLIRIVGELLEGLTPDYIRDHFQPRHGPGAFGWVDQKGKVRSGRPDARAKDVRTNWRFLAEVLERFSITDRWVDTPSDDGGYRFAPSQVRAVPKSWKKKRLIAIEDVTRMWGQQGIRAALYAWFEDSPVIASHVNLRNAEWNREACRRGSFTGHYATVDLSSASDSVGYSFVRELLQETNPFLWELMDTFRSPEFLIGGELIPNKIFATMGNAVCFPIETLVFLGISLEAAERTGSHTSPYVYGDDIVCGSDTVDDLLRLLSGYGFSVNASKTYTEGTFRESCGIECLKGHDITPRRISRRFKTLSSRPKSLDNWSIVRDLHNRFTNGSASQAFLRELFTLAGLNPPCTPDGRLGLSDPSRHVLEDSVLERVPATDQLGDYQAEGYRVKFVLPTLRRRRRCDTPALMEWLAKRRGDDRETIGGLVEPHITSEFGMPNGYAVCEGFYVPHPGYIVMTKSNGKTVKPAIVEPTDLVSYEQGDSVQRVSW